TEPVRVGKRVHESSHEVLFLADQFAVLTPNGIDAVSGHLRTEQCGNFICKQSGTVHEAAGFDFTSGAGHANAVARKIEMFDAGMGDDIRAILRGDTSVGFDELFARDNPGGGYTDGFESFNVGFASAD